MTTVSAVFASSFLPPSNLPDPSGLALAAALCRALTCPTL
jgi:hypothetical protein